MLILIFDWGYLFLKVFFRFEKIKFLLFFNIFTFKGIYLNKITEKTIKMNYIYLRVLIRYSAYFFGASFLNALITERLINYGIPAFNPIQCLQLLIPTNNQSFPINGCDCIFIWSDVNNGWFMLTYCEFLFYRIIGTNKYCYWSVVEALVLVFSDESY